MNKLKRNNPECGNKTIEMYLNPNFSFRFPFFISRRYVFPAKFVLIRGPEGCAILHDRKTWKVFEKQMSQMLSSDKNAKTLVRSIVESAFELFIGKNKLVRLPKEYRDILEIKSDKIILVDLKGKYSIWDKNKYLSILSKIDNFPAHKRKVLKKLI